MRTRITGAVSLVLLLGLCMFSIYETPKHLNPPQIPFSYMIENKGSLDGVYVYTGGEVTGIKERGDLMEFELEKYPFIGYEKIYAAVDGNIPAAKQIRNGDGIRVGGRVLLEDDRVHVMADEIYKTGNVKLMFAPLNLSAVLILVYFILREWEIDFRGLSVKLRWK